MQVGNAYIIVYSITDRSSFESASELRIQLRRIRQAENIPIILVGNKSDLVRSREVAVEGKCTLAILIVHTLASYCDDVVLWGQTMVLHNPDLPWQRVGLAQWCSIASSSKPAPPSTTTFTSSSRASCVRFD